MFQEVAAATGVPSEAAAEASADRARAPTVVAGPQVWEAAVVVVLAEAVGAGGK